MKVLVVGTGPIGVRHLGILSRMPGVEPVAVPTRAERVTELLEQGHEAVWGLGRALNESPRAAVIATDTGRHVTDAAQCLDANCDVLIEKPMARTASEAAGLQNVELKANRRVHIASNLRFDPSIRWLRDQLPGLGALWLVDVECLSWLPQWRPHRHHAESYSARPDEGGVLRDLIHEIDLCLWLLGTCRRVSAKIENRGAVGLPTAVEETAIMTLEHEQGVTASVRLSYGIQPESRRMRFWGEHGMLEWDYIAGRAVERGCNGVVRACFSRSSHDRESTYEDQIIVWLDTLVGGNGGGLANLTDGIRSLVVRDAARHSATTASWEELPG